MCPRFPYPLEKGDKLRMFHQLRYLGKMHDVLLIALSSKAVSDKDLNVVKALVSQVKIYKVSTLGKGISMMRCAFSNLPFQVGYYYDRNVHNKIKKDISNFNPDHLYCQLTRMSKYTEGISVSKTIDYMDAFGIGMERRADVVSGLMAAIYRAEAKRMKQYESAIYDHFDSHVVISEQDNQQISSKDITVIPNGIDTDHFSPMMNVEKKYDIGFIGNMGYAPNIDAAEYLINKIKPRLPSDLSFVIAGARPDNRVKLLASNSVTITGWMDDVRTAYAESKIFVAPLWLGTGQQNKILEAMAMGIPCITSTTVNNAIGAQPYEEILIADNVEQYVTNIDKLLNDPSLYHTIKENAITFVKRNFSWEESVQKLNKVFEKKTGIKK